MGQFSWIACDDKKSVLDNVVADVYLLIPAEFGGGYYHERCYDGYGRFGGVDVYDVVVDWNKKYLKKLIVKPELSDYSGCYVPSWDIEDLEKKLGRKATEDELEALGKKLQEERFNNALKGHERELQKCDDMLIYSDEHMTDIYGVDWKRSLGIDIACYDEQNGSLPYPIKISHKPMKYEDATPSISDLNQGWGCNPKKCIHAYDEFLERYYNNYKQVGDNLREGKE